MSNGVDCLKKSMIVPVGDERSIPFKASPKVPWMLMSGIGTISTLPLPYFESKAFLIECIQLRETGPQHAIQGSR